MRALIIPAAGRGSRLGGPTPKPLVAVNGRPMLSHLADLYRPFASHIVVVAHPSFRAEVEAWAAASPHVTVAEQPEPTGMLDAICVAAPVVERLRPDVVWISWADQIGVLPETLRRLAAVETSGARPALVLPTVSTPDPYIHFERDAAGRIAGLLQRREGDRMPPVGESDMGVFALARETFTSDLPIYADAVARGAGTGERNFLPFIPWLAARKDVRTIECTDPRERVGINTPEECEFVAAWLRSRVTPA